MRTAKAKPQRSTRRTSGLLSGGRTPLQYAAVSGDSSAIYALLDTGADVNIKDKNGCTPLHQAAKKGHPSRHIYTYSIKLLIAHGADTTIKNKEGKTPAKLGKENGKEEEFNQGVNDAKQAAKAAKKAAKAAKRLP